MPYKKRFHLKSVKFKVQFTIQKLKNIFQSKIATNHLCGPYYYYKFIEKPNQINN